MRRVLGRIAEWVLFSTLFIMGVIGFGVSIGAIVQSVMHRDIVNLIAAVLLAFTACITAWMSRDVMCNWL